MENTLSAQVFHNLSNQFFPYLILRNKAELVDRHQYKKAFEVKENLTYADGNSSKIKLPSKTVYCIGMFLSSIF